MIAPLSRLEAAFGIGLIGTMLLLVGASPCLAEDNPNYVNVTRIYTSCDGESHFSDYQIPLTDEGPIGSISNAINTTQMWIRYTPGTYAFTAHHAPRRQFVISLDSGVKLVTSDGDSRLLLGGAISFLEDTYGAGHSSYAYEQQPRMSLFIGVPDDYVAPGPVCCNCVQPSPEASASGELELELA